MAVAAGAKVRGSQINESGASTRTANSANATASEIEIDSLTVPVRQGLTYRVVWDGAVMSSNATGYGRVRIRESSVSGTILRDGNYPTTLGSNLSVPGHVEARWQASTTGTFTFKATLERMAGTGNCIAQAGTTNPTSFYVENT
jgi:hypothetical protein